MPATQRGSRRLVTRFVTPFVSLPFDNPYAEHYVQVRVELQRAGRIIGANDLMIAATALAHQFTLVTYNTGEF